MSSIVRHGRWLLAATFLSGAPALHADTQIADIRQGTNLAVAISPDRSTLVVDLLEQLWSLPATGGGAVPLTPSGERVRQPRFSPDGRFVVHQRLVNGQWDIWLLELQTGAQRPLVTSPNDEREPDFTADGQSVVFAANRTGRSTLWAVRIADGVETQLTEEPGDASFPSVADNGLIAYVVDDDRESRLRVLQPTGASSTVYSSSVARLGAPTWRPGGGVIVFGELTGPRRSQLGMLVLGEPRVLKAVSGNEDVFYSRVAWTSPAEFIYAADGQLWQRGIASPARRAVHLFAAAAVEAPPAPANPPTIDAARSRPIAQLNGYTRSADGRRATFSALGDIWLAERGQLQRLTDDAFVDRDPVFWPDGDSIVFASERSGQFELWRVMLRDRRFTQLTFGAHRPHLPAVSPQGREVAFVELDGIDPLARARVKVLRLLSGTVETLAEDVIGADRPTWSAEGDVLSIRARSARRADRTTGPSRVEWLQPLSLPARSTDPATAEESPPLPEWQPPPPPADYVLRAGRLFDGVRSDYRRHVDIHVRNGRIAAIVSRGALPTPPNVIDRLDATVIPGLIDVHAHQTSLVGERLGRAWLAYGVTTVRELATDVAAASERAETWASGTTPGPRLIVADAAPGSSGMSTAVIAHGFAHSLAGQARTLGIPRLPARRTTIDAFGLAPTRYELEVSPAFAVYQDGLGRLIAAGTFISPGLAALAGQDVALAAARLRDDPAYSALYSAAERSVWAERGPSADVVPPLQQTVARLIRGGGRVAIGSDAPSVPFGLGLHRELALLAGAGVANDQVLRLATASGALALRLELETGTLEDGKRADFVVIDGDPLARIEDTLKITAVAKDGFWFERQALLQEPR